jgi:uncharacterized repeat protein (TIGR03943 family)
VERLITPALLVLLGGTVLAVGLTDAYLAYVQPGFRPLLVVSGAVLVVLSLAGPVLDRPRPATAGEHGHVPWSSWLLLLPVAVLLLVAPPALGVFTAQRQAQPVAAATAEQPPRSAPGEDGVRAMSVLEYGMWALADDPSYVAGGPVRLQGFVVPRGEGGWYVARIRIGCCAADAVPTSVVVLGGRDDVEAGAWVEVEGTWAPPVDHPEAGYPEPVLEAAAVTPIEPPANPYEG